MTQTQRIAEIVDRLDCHPGDNIWQDLILTLPEYDEAATDAIEHGQGDSFVLTDGTVIFWDAQTNCWYAR